MAEENPQGDIDRMEEKYGVTRTYQAMQTWMQYIERHPELSKHIVRYVSERTATRLMLNQEGEQAAEEHLRRRSRRWYED